MEIENRNALLDAAKALVIAGWCQDHFAKDASGDPVPTCDFARFMARAKSFCARGACLAAAAGDLPTFLALDESLEAAIRTRIDASLDSTVAKYNNAPGRTKFEVAAIFDIAKEQP